MKLEPIRKFGSEAVVPLVAHRCLSVDLEDCLVVEIRGADSDAWSDGEMDPEVDGWFAYRATFDYLAKWLWIWRDRSKRGSHMTGADPLTPATRKLLVATPVVVEAGLRAATHVLSELNPDTVARAVELSATAATSTGLAAGTRFDAQGSP